MAKTLKNPSENSIKLLNTCVERIKLSREHYYEIYIYEYNACDISYVTTKLIEAGYEIRFGKSGARFTGNKNDMMFITNPFIKIY